ncbi:putative enoyl-CoA hydratase echA8 [compost metagenome]
MIRKIGEGKARDLLLSGRLITASEAKEFGLINYLVTKHQLAEEVRLFAEKLSNETSANSIAYTKDLIQKVQQMKSEEALVYAAETNAHIRSTEDFKKGVNSFLTKTKLKW